MVINLGSVALRALLAVSAVILVVTGRGSGDTGILWAEARDATELLAMHRTVSQQRMIHPQMSVVLGVSSPAQDLCKPSSLTSRS